MKLILILITFFALPLQGWENIPPCFKEFEQNFFKQELVLQSFDLHHMYLSHASVVYVALIEAAKDVPDIVKAKAKTMNPNPLHHPFQREIAEKILKQTLEEVFIKVLTANYVADQPAINEAEIKGMFEYIFSRQHAAWARCFGQPKKKAFGHRQE